MTFQKSIIALLVAFFLLSCTRNYKLSPDDYSWMPYKGNEILVFSSNLGETDTIFFIKKDTTIAYPEAQALFGRTYEEVGVFCKHSAESLAAGEKLYGEGYFATLKKSKDKKARLDISLKAKDSWFYRIEGVRLDSLKKLKPMVLKTKNKVYNDVYIVEDIDWMNLKQRSNYVTNVYWSKSEGVVRFDKQNNVYWELTNKFYR
jgi:hypothetical protein